MTFQRRLRTYDDMESFKVTKAKFNDLRQIELTERGETSISKRRRLPRRHRLTGLRRSEGHTGGQKGHFPEGWKVCKFGRELTTYVAALRFLHGFLVERGDFQNRSAGEKGKIKKDKEKLRIGLSM